MDNNITTILNSLIQNGLISQGHVFVLIIIVVLFAFRKLINPLPQASNQVTNHDCIMIKEHEVKLNTIIDKINDITLSLQTLKTTFENIDKKVDSNMYDIKLKLSETSQDIQKLENIKEILTTFIARSV